MGSIPKLLVELIEAAQYDISLIQAVSAKEPAMIARDRQLLRDVQHNYHDLIAQLHLAVADLDSRGAMPRAQHR